MRYRTIWWDLETGGLNPFHNPIVEIGAIDNTDNQFNQLLRQEKPLDKKIVEITKITDQMIQEHGRDYEQVIREFYNYITNTPNADSKASPYRRTFMIAHNGDGFDRMFLKTAFKKYGLKIPQNIYFIDSLHFARMLLPWRYSYRQELLAQQYHIQNPHAHRALGDVIVLRQIWENLVKVYSSDNLIDIYNDIYF